MQVLWLRFLTEIDEHTQKVPAELLENAEVSEALEMVERAEVSPRHYPSHTAATYPSRTGGSILFKILTI